jgi:hypothetical protein
MQPAGKFQGGSVNKHPEIKQELDQAGIEIPDCPQCGDPMTLMRLRTNVRFDLVEADATFECEKIPVRLGHQFSMYAPDVCVRCGQTGVSYSSPCSADKTDHDHVIVEVQSTGGQIVDLSWY